MNPATSSAPGTPTRVMVQDRWSRVFATLSFGTAHLDNTCALAWYASHLNSAGRLPRRGEPLDLAGPDATRSRRKRTATRRTSPTEGDRT